MEIKFRLTPDLFREMQKYLAHNTAVEQGCFLLCSEAKANDQYIVIAKELIPLKQSQFVIQKYDQLSVSPSAMLSVSRLAQSKNCGVCFVHTHPMSFGEVKFSPADDYGNIRTFDFFNRMLPSNANTALVFSGDMNTVSGRLYHKANSWRSISSITVVGHPAQLTTINNLTVKEIY